MHASHAASIRLCRLLTTCATFAIRILSQLFRKIFSVFPATSASRMVDCCSYRFASLLGPLPGLCQVPYSSNTNFASFSIP